MAVVLEQEKEERFARDSSRGKCGGETDQEVSRRINRAERTSDSTTRKMERTLNTVNGTEQTK